MNKSQTFQEFMTTHSVNIPVLGFVTNLIIVFVLAYLLQYIYVKYGRALSNRRRFANNFVIMAMTTMFIIAVVKSSLALSLGLVGALSIVRFRAAIKDPEELTYLFLTIAIGLGLGADQRLITLVASLTIMSLIILRRHGQRTEQNKFTFLSISSQAGKKFSLEKITKILSDSCLSVDLKRFDETNDALEAVFYVEFADFNSLELTRRKLTEEDDTLKISFLDNRLV